MTSKAHGKLVLLVWSDNGVIKPLVLDTGAIPTTETDPITSLDVDIKACAITLPVAEQSPLTTIDTEIKACAITLPVAEQTPLQWINVKNYSLWGGAWRQQPIMWGYSDTWAEEVYVANAPAGTNTLASAAVPAGYVYVLMGMTTLNGLTVTTQQHDMILSSITCRMGVYTGVGAGVTQPTFPINTQLKQGDYARGVFLACTLNDNLYARFWGYKMVIS